VPKVKPIKNVVVISDTHSGCQLALCPPKVKLDSGGFYQPSPLQVKLWYMWREFWDEWVPMATKGEDFILVHNGDAIDGVHHNSVTQISHNITDQIQIAKDLLEPIIKNPKCKAYYHIRGTEAHVGQSGQSEEGLARSLGAVPDDIGNYARWEMWMNLNKKRIHFTHHIGSTNSASYESTAPYKEYIESLIDSARWKNEPPDVIVRSHRHRAFETRVATANGYGISVVTPAWQLQTPFTFRMALGRSSMPQIGGILIREGDEDSIFTRSKIWNIERPKEVIV
jgi:hypothetical protein